MQLQTTIIKSWWVGFCSIFVMGAWTAAADDGVEVVVAAQEDPSAIVQIQKPGDALRQWLKSKGWTADWDSEKNRMIFVLERGARIRPNDPDFLDKRTALYNEVELRLKGDIITALYTKVDASVFISIPGNSLEKEFKARTDEYTRKQIAAMDALDDAKMDYEDVLTAEELASIDALEGITSADRWNAILDGIAKRLDESYSTDDISQDKAERAASLRQQLAAAAQKVREAEDFKAALDAEADIAVKVLRDEFQKKQSSEVGVLSEMPLLGAVMLKTAESYDGKRDYRVAGAMAWSPRLQKDAADLLLGIGKPEARPSRQSFEEWISAQDLSDVIGTRRFLAADGSVHFVGFAASEYDPEQVESEGAAKRATQLKAIGMAALSMKADVSVNSRVKTQAFSVGGESLTYESVAEELSQTTGGQIAISGMVSVDPIATIHKPSGKPIVVGYAHINSDLAAKSEPFREEASALELWINEDQSAQRGREAGRKAAADAAKNDPKAYADGFDRGKAGVEATDAANRAAVAPAPEAQRPLPMNPQPTGQAQSGTFMDDTDVEDDF